MNNMLDVEELFSTKASTMVIFMPLHTIPDSIKENLTAPALSEGKGSVIFGPSFFMATPLAV